MVVEPGARIGTYDVTAKLGEGGMGEVWRATDTTLDRQVAIKILPDALAADPERLARFEREAKTLASLNHPHIATIYGFEKSSGAYALVMELVEGEDLSQRIARGAIPIDEALPIARQMAEALEAAHEQGIIHRDLKPANVKVRADGTVKVLDFGLAKAIEGASGAGRTRGAGQHEAAQSPTITSPAVTAAGMILGTAAYMSPEQARGRPVDRRADLWALGCVIYEMLTGRQVFGGPTVSDVIAGVLRGEPDWTTLPAPTPPAIRRLLQRALQRDPHDRLRDAGDARLEIEQARRELSDPDTVTPRPTPSRGRSIAPAIAAVVALAIGIAAGIWWQRSQQTSTRWAATEVGGPRIAFMPRLSPDGRMLGFITIADGQSQLAVMDTGSGDWSFLTTQRGIGPVISVSWSRDGSRVYFDRFNAGGRRIFSVSPLGGEARLVLENAFSPAPLPDGSLLFLRINREGMNELHRYWPDAGRTQAFAVHVHTSFAPSLRVFPDGREAAVFGRLFSGVPGALTLLAIDVDSGSTRVLAASQDFGEFVGSEGVVPIGISADGSEVLTTTRSGGASQVVTIARDGRSAAQPLFTTTRLVSAIEEGNDGQYYIDQLDRSLEHLRVPVTGGVPERLAAGLPSLTSAGALALANGRFLYATVIGGRPRLVSGRPGQELVPFVETQEQARAPMARVSDTEFLFVAGTRENPVLAIASSETGRVLRRLEGTRGRQIARLAVSPDGTTVYFSASGRIWSLPMTDGDARELTLGNGVAPDPQGRFLVIDRQDAAGPQLLRRDSNGTETRITLPTHVRATALSVWPRSLDARGFLLFVAESDDSWFWGPAVLDLNTNQVTRIPLTFAGDAEVDAAWDGDAAITVLARRMESTIWRFERTPD